LDKKTDSLRTTFFVWHELVVFCILTEGTNKLFFSKLTDPIQNSPSSVALQLDSFTGKNPKYLISALPLVDMFDNAPELQVTCV
jgi:hypothetical protein